MRTMAKERLVNPPDWRSDTVLPLPAEVRANAWAVDAADEHYLQIGRAHV